MSSNFSNDGPVAPNKQPEDLGSSPNPYHRIELFADRVEVYPTDRLFQKCIAVTRLYVLMVLLPCGVTFGGIMIACITLPNALLAASVLLALLAPIVALMFVIWSQDRQAHLGCSIPLVMSGGDGCQISYRGELLASLGEIASVRVLRLVFEDSADLYSVGFATLDGKNWMVPSCLPVTWWYGTGQGYYGGWSDQTVAELLARDLARILDRPLSNAEEVRF